MATVSAKDFYFHIVLGLKPLLEAFVCSLSLVLSCEGICHSPLSSIISEIDAVSLLPDTDNTCRSPQVTVDPLAIFGSSVSCSIREGLSVWFGLGISGGYCMFYGAVVLCYIVFPLFYSFVTRDVTCSLYVFSFISSFSLLYCLLICSMDHTLSP